jgi:general secretion pathway protein D
MNKPTRDGLPARRNALALLLAAGGLALAPASLALQPAAPPPTTPPATTPPAATPPATPPTQPATPAQPATPPPAVTTEANGRRTIDGPPTKLAFKNVSVEQVIPFIVEATGKVVIPQQDVLTRRVTVLNDREIPRARALDMVVLALQQAGVAVIETHDIVTLRDINEIVRGGITVIGPDESTIGRTDVGSIAEKTYRLKHSTAENYADVLKNAIPDYAKLTVDKESNQVAILGPIGLLQRMEKLITSLDQPAAGAVVAETFRLRYADAEQVAKNIQELFGEGSGTTGNQRNNNRQQQGPFVFGPQQRQDTPTASSAQLRVSSSTQQNAVTVVADPAVVEAIRKQIEDYWDQPLSKENVVPKVYDLKNSDPVKVKTALEALFGRGAGATTPTGGGGGQNQANSSASQGAGRLAGQFSFTAIPESGRLAVVAKSIDNMSVIDDIIEQLDKPQSAGLPEIIELKHANAEDLAEQLNALLAMDGTLAQIRRSESGLSDTTSTTSPFATDQAQDTGATDAATSPENISFWWQRSRPPTDKANASNLVGQLRIVPVWRQNALMVLSPPEYRASITKLVTDLDQPGRQVLISAIVLDISRDDATALGFRWSSSAITPTNPDNSITIGASSQNTKNNFLPGLFDSSVLNANVDLNVMLQALAEKTDVNILSEPKIFTSDNQEAEFFSGQDIPFITESQPNTQGNVVNSFDYRAVGIQLRVRPRITVRQDVDLKINLELSSTTPGNTLFGGAIVDRRETTTQLIVKNGQTVVISGILRAEDSEIKRKVPLLGDIPLIGLLFQSIEKSKTDKELLVFITPLVIENTEDLAPANKPYLDQLERRREQFRPKEGTEGLPGKIPEHTGEPTALPDPDATAPASMQGKAPEPVRQ